GGGRGNPGADGAAGAGRATDFRRGGGHLPAGALLLGAAGALAEAPGAEAGGGRSHVKAKGLRATSIASDPLWLRQQITAIRYHTPTPKAVAAPGEGDLDVGRLA